MVTICVQQSSHENIFCRERRISTDLRNSVKKTKLFSHYIGYFGHMSFVSVIAMRSTKNQNQKKGGKRFALQCICKLFLSVLRKSGHEIAETETRALNAFPFDVDCLSQWMEDPPVDVFWTFLVRRFAIGTM